MNQDSEKNDRGDRPRRDGNPPRWTGSSGGRRDDAPRFTRNENNERPRFSRSDNPRDGFDREQKPRFNRDQANKPFDERRPRNNDRSDDRRRDDRNSNSERPRFEKKSRGFQDGESNNRRFDDKPRSADNRRSSFDRDGERPGRFERNNDRAGSERRFNDSNDERPRFRRDDRNSNSERPWFTDKQDDRPRFRQDDRTSDRPRFADKKEDRPRFRRDDEQNDRPRFRRDEGQEDRPRFRRDDRNGDQPRAERFPKERSNDREGFKREWKGDADRRNDTRPGGFRREEGNRESGQFQKEGRRTSRRANDDLSRDNETPRFSSQQRKESGDRRTGKYEKAPNYDLQNLDFPRKKKPFKTNRSDKSEQVESKPKTHTGGPEQVRLNRYIANSGVCSRREADELIARGDISVNGKIVTEMGFKVKEGDTVKYGTKVLNPERFVYVLLNKPKDYITTTDDPEERRTVMELVADAGSFRMYPVGRLDRNTTGLLLLTNDGELAEKLTHPSNEIRKVYQVEIDKPITEEHFEAIQKGLELEDGPIKPDALSIVTPDAQVVGIEIHSGRNRIVRRIFEHFGYEVTKLDRTAYAGLTKKDLPRGKWRFLEPKEVVKLKYFN